MFRAWYRSSRAAAIAGVAVFAVSVLLMRAFDVPARVALAPGLLLAAGLRSLGADITNRMELVVALFAWCLIADALFLLVRRPWRERE